MAKSKPNKSSGTGKQREAGSRLVVTGKPTVRREGETVIVSVPIKVYRLNGRQMILAEGSKAEEGQAPKALNLPLITSIASPCFSSHCHKAIFAKTSIGGKIAKTHVFIRLSSCDSLGGESRDLEPFGDLEPIWTGNRPRVSHALRR